MNTNIAITKSFNSLKRIFKITDAELTIVPAQSVSEIEYLDRLSEELDEYKDSDKRIKFLKSAIGVYLNTYSNEGVNDTLLANLFKAIQLAKDKLDEVQKINEDDGEFEDMSPEVPEGDVDDQPEPELGTASEWNDDSLEVEDLVNDSAETSFEEEFPNIDAENLLEVQYQNWLEEVKNKTFYKIIRGYQIEEQGGSLNLDDRTFLWKLIKAISSCITHLAIEVEIHPESLILFEEYYDGLVACMNNIVHARTQSDIQASYLYMCEMLSLIDSNEDDIQDSMDPQM